MPKKMSGSEEKTLRILRARAYREQGGLCYWCKTPMIRDADESNPLQLTGDHLIPLHAGGKTVPGNIVAACRGCNCHRHPELNRTRGGATYSTGEAPSESPFAVLAGRL
jgi:5-methylcytosine-specific restriction endonuclease McrA